MIAPSSYETLLALFNVVNALFACAFGACIGSLINVLVYRMPLGLGVVTPPSRCPNCETRLTWRENIPIFGWLMLRGRCKFCRSPVSAEYPIVEAVVAAIFGLVFLKLYTDGSFIGVNFNAIAPRWGWGGFALTWPTMITALVLISCLVAATLIDARTFQIPLVLTWVPAATAFVLNLVQLGLFSLTPTGQLPHLAKGWNWTIATPGPYGWAWFGASFGGMFGLAVGNLLLARGLIKRSFFDYESWLESANKDAGSPEGTEGASTSDDPSKWIEYPHARREMLRELIFLAPCIGFALLGASLAIKLAGPWTMNFFTGESFPASKVPLWLDVPAAVCMGYIVGGGVVWLWRIAGTLLVGREALGLGDVHLMAAVGACLGWPHSILGFFAAAFVGVFWTLVSKLVTGKLQRQMPFGPYLAIGTILVWYFQPLAERLLGLILRSDGPLVLP